MTRKFAKSFVGTFLTLLLMLSFFAFESSASAVSINVAEFNLTKGYQTTLEISAPLEIDTSDTVWTTGNKSVATVSSDGTVIGKDIGTTYIYAKVGEDTMKSLVHVVAGKIYADRDSLDLELGETATVRIRALGTHLLSVSSSNKSVAKASWNGAKFDGDYVNLTLTALDYGNSQINIYASDYASEVFDTINVTVGNSEFEQEDEIITVPDSNDNGNDEIITNVTNLTIAKGTKGKFYVRTFLDVNAIVANMNIINASVIDSTNGISTVEVLGIANGSSVVRIFDKDDYSNYIDININVTGSNESVGSAGGYYALSTVSPQKYMPNDLVIKVDTAYGVKYMLVPAEYDVAYVNTAVAKQTNNYQSYKIYSEKPVVSSTQTLKTVSAFYNGQAVVRYILAPTKFDQAEIDTIIAEYSGIYEYYKIYTKMPSLSGYNDEVMNWKKNIAGSFDSVNRYMLVPYGMTNSWQANQIKTNDMLTSITPSINPNQYYKVLSSYPNNLNSSDEELLIWYNSKSSTYRYMVVPKSNCDFVARNDAILSDTDEYCYYNAYSSKPTITNSATQSILTASISRPNSSSWQKVYILVNPQHKLQNTVSYNALVDNAVKGNDYYNMPQ